MTLEYDLQPEDLAAFAEYAVTHHPASVGPIASIQNAGAVVITFVVLLLWAVSDQVWWLSGLPLGAFWVWWWPRHVLKVTRTHALSDPRRCTGHRHTIDASSDGIRTVCPSSEMLFRWPMIRDIAGIRDHVFVLAEGGMYIVIPRSRVRSGDLEEFTRVVANHIRHDA